MTMRSAARAQHYYEPASPEPPFEPAVAPIAVEAAPPPPRKPPPLLLRRSFWRALFSTDFDKSRGRIRLVALLFAALFCVFVGRLAYLGMTPGQASARREASEAVSAARPDLTDRNGQVLATDVKVMSVFAEPRSIIDKDEAVEQLTAILPDLNAGELRERLSKKKGFVWVKREVTPVQRQQIFRLGLPAVWFLARAQARLSQRSAGRPYRRLHQRRQQRLAGRRKIS